MTNSKARFASTSLLALNALNDAPAQTKRPRKRPELGRSSHTLQLMQVLSLQHVLAHDFVALADGLHSCVGLHLGIQRNQDQLVRQPRRC